MYKYIMHIYDCFKIFDIILYSLDGMVDFFCEAS